MADCLYSVDEIRFDTTDPDATLVYVLVHVRGDCPEHIAGWYCRVFPAHLQIGEIHRQLFTKDNGPLSETGARQWTRARPSLECVGDLPAPALDSGPVHALRVLERYAALVPERHAYPTDQLDGLAYALTLARNALAEADAFTITQRATLAVALERIAARCFENGRLTQDAGSRLLAVVDAYSPLARETLP